MGSVDVGTYLLPGLYCYVSKMSSRVCILRIIGKGGLRGEEISLSHCPQIPVSPRTLVEFGGQVRSSGPGSGGGAS